MKLNRRKNRLLHKIITIFCVFILLSTFATSVMASNNFFSKIKEKTQEKNTFISKILEKLKDRDKPIIDRIREIIDEIKSIRNSKKDNEQLEELDENKKKILLTYIDKIKQNNASLKLKFFTNYNGITQESELFLFKETKIDINYDGTDDISAKCTILPGITKPLALSINFKLTIEKISNLPYEDGFFEGFLELHFPGFLNQNNTGDKVRFGYQSDLYEKIPDKCEVTYKFIPYILYRNKRAGHAVKIDPGDIAGDDKLSIIYSYIDMDEDTKISEDKFRIEYNPASKAEIKIDRTKNLAQSIFNFERIRTDDSQVNVYLSHEENDNTTYLYAKKIPKEVSFTLKRGKSGLLSFDSNGESVEEIGICDDLYEPKNKIYVSGLPHTVKLEWNRYLFFRGKINASLIAGGKGISLNGDLTGSEMNALFSIKSNSNIDCSVEYDAKNNHFILTRSEMDLSLYLYADDGNETLFEGSMDIKRLQDRSFEIIYDGILDGEGYSQFYLGGKRFEINNLEINISSTLIGANIYISMDQLIKYKEGGLNASFLLEKNPGKIKASARFDIIRGIKYSNLYINFNGFGINPEDKDIQGNKTLWFNFTLAGIVLYDIAPDFSEGWINIKGVSTFSINSLFERNEIKGGVQGIISFGTHAGGFNFSWHTENINGTDTRVFNINGGTLVSLEDFHLWYGDIIDVKIPEFNGSIILKNASLNNGKLILNITGSGTSGSFMDFSFSSTDYLDPNEFDMVLNVSMENITFGTHLYASAVLEWENSTVSDLKFEVGADINLNIDKLLIYFKLKNNSFRFLSDAFSVSGGISFAFDLAEPDGFTLKGPLSITLDNADIYLHIVDLDLTNFGIPLDLDDITLDAETVGIASISLEEISIDNLDYLYGVDLEKIGFNFSWVNISLLVDTTYGDLDLNLFEIGNIIQILALVFGLGLLALGQTRLSIENLSFKNGHSLITIPILLAPFGPLGLGIRFENSFTTQGENILTLDKLRLVLTDITLGNLTEGLGVSFGEFDDSALTVFIENTSFKDGVFDFYFELMPTIRLTIADASAVNNLDLGGGFPGVAYALGSIEDKFEYLNIHVNNAFNSESDLNEPPEYFLNYILVDSHNTTIPFDVELWVESEFINFMADYIENSTGFSLPKAKSDIGLRFDHVTFLADAFKINKFVDNKDESNNRTWMEGYLEVIAGQIWLYMNNSWTQIGDGEISISIEPGHARLYIDEIVTLPDYNYVSPDGTEIALSGTFIANNTYLDIYWNSTTGNVSFDSKFDVKLKDFKLKVGDIVDLSIGLIEVKFDVNGVATNALSIISNNNNESIWFEVDANIETITFEDFYLSVSFEQSEESPKGGKQSGTLNYTVTLTGEFDLSLVGDIYIFTNLKDVLSVQLAEGELQLNNFTFSFKKQNTEMFFLSWAQFKVSGYGMVTYLGDKITVDATIDTIKFVDGFVKVSYINIGIGLAFSGNFDLSAATDFSIVLNSNMELESLDLELSGTLKLSGFTVTAYLAGLPIEFSGFSATIAGTGIIHIRRGGIDITAGINTFGISNCHVSTPRVNITGKPIKINESDYFFDIELSLDLDISGGAFIKYHSGVYQEFKIMGGGELTLSNAEITIIPKKVVDDSFAEDVGSFTVTCDYLHIAAVGSFVTQTFNVVNNQGQSQGSDNFWRVFLNVYDITISRFAITGDMSEDYIIEDLDVSASVNASFYVYAHKNYDGKYAEIGAMLYGGSISASFSRIKTPTIDMSLDLFEISGQGLAKLVLEGGFNLKDNLKFVGAAGIARLEINKFQIDYLTTDEGVTRYFGIDVNRLLLYAQGGFALNFIDKSEENLTVSLNAATQLVVDEFNGEFSWVSGDISIDIDSLVLQGKLSVFYDKSRSYFAGSASIEAGWNKLEIIGPGGSSLLVNNFELASGGATVLLYAVQGGILSSSGGVSTLTSEDDPTVYTHKELFVSLNCSLVSWSSILITGPEGKTITFPELNVVDVFLEFTVSGEISLDEDDILIDLRFNSGKTQSITINGIGAFIAECIDSWLLDNWDINGFSIDLSSGTLNLKIRKYSTSEYPSVIDIGIHSTCYATITWLEAEHSSEIINSITIANLEIDPGSFSWSSSRTSQGNNEKGFIDVSTTGSIQPTAEILEIGIGSFEFSLSSITFTSPGFTTQWDITSTDSFPYSTGSFYIDGGIEWSGHTKWGKIKFSNSLVADNFSISWTDFNNTENVFDMVNYAGTFDIGTIEVLVISSWIVLWPILGGNDGEPIADAGGPYEYGEVPATVEFDFSGCYDPNGDQITEMNMCLGLDMTWTGWMTFYEHPQHTYMTAGERTIKLKVKDENGDISDISTAIVNVGTNTFKISGNVTDSVTGEPLTWGNNNALVEVLYESKSGQVNSQGYYILPDLEKNSWYKLRCTADGYFTEEYVILAENANSDMTIDFALTKGHMQVNILINEMEVDEENNPIHEFDLFTANVTDVSSREGVLNAEVTYQYKDGLSWYQVNDPDNPEETDYSGKASFEAIEVPDSDFDGKIQCRVKVTHENYESITSYTFYVYDDNSGDPYFTEDNSHYTSVQEGAAATKYIHGYDPNGDRLYFSVNYNDIDYEMSYSEETIIDELYHGKYVKINGVQYDSNTLELKIWTNYDEDTDDDYVELLIKLSDEAFNYDFSNYDDTWPYTITIIDRGTCLLSGSKITMNDDIKKNIEEIKVGDFVKSYNDKNGEITISEVTKIYHHRACEMTDYYLIINDKLRITPNHRFYLNGEWIHAGKAKIGDKLYDINGETQTIFSIEKIYEKVPTYNFEVNTTHSFYAENLLVHNGDQK